jgi:hypothetical protein
MAHPSDRILRFARPERMTVLLALPASWRMRVSTNKLSVQDLCF